MKVFKNDTGMICIEEKHGDQLRFYTQGRDVFIDTNTNSNLDNKTDRNALLEEVDWAIYGTAIEVIEALKEAIELLESEVTVNG